VCVYVQTKYGSGDPCFGVAMFASGNEMYLQKGRFYNPETWLDLGVIVDEARLNFTLVHHEFLELNISTAQILNSILLECLYIVNILEH
jgi:hypothetical protein